MLSQDLPEAFLLEKTSELLVLMRSLTTVLDNTPHTCYRYIAPIRESACSGRVLSPEPYLDCVSLPRAVTPGQMAAELLRLGREEARYDPPEKPRGVKGWEVRKLKDFPIAVVYAAWID